MKYGTGSQIAPYAPCLRTLCAGENGGPYGAFSCKLPEVCEYNPCQTLGQV